MTTKKHHPAVSHHKPPAVSIIIAAFNAAGFIADALNSVLAQDFADYEIVVINDGSPDTPELERVLAPFSDRMVYIRQENRGISGARNTAIRAARGQLIALLDADDLWTPNYLSVQIAKLRADPTIDVLYPNAIFFGDGPEVGRDFMSVCPSEGDVTFESLLSQRCHVMVSVMARREALERAGLFDEDLRSCEDFDLWLRMVRNGSRISYHREKLVYYRRHKGSLSSDPVWLLDHGLKVLHKLEAASDLLPNEREMLAENICRFRAMLDFAKGKEAFLKGEPAVAVEHLERANGYMQSRKMSFSILGLRLAPRFVWGVYKFRDRLLHRNHTHAHASR